VANTDRRKAYQQIINKGPRKSQTAKAKKTKVTEVEVLQQDPGRMPSPDKSSEATNFLGSLMQATIFFDYFEHVAEKTYRGDRVDVKVAKLKSVHPQFHQFCIKADSAVRVLGVAALYMFAVASLIKLVFF
jgi:hypothetical protein